MKDAIMRFIKAAMVAKHLDETLTKSGYAETPYATIYDEIAEGLYKMLGEHTEKFADSETYTVLNAPALCDERRAAMLNYVYEKNHTMPKPDTIETEEMRAMVKKNGGYLHETPEGDWS